MEAKQVMDMMEAYASIYVQPEEDQEIITEDPVQDYRDMKRGKENAAGMRGPELSHANKTAGGGTAKTHAGGITGTKPKSQVRSREFSKEPAVKGVKPQARSREFAHKEEVETDFFDYILEYLVAEGYADTNENALVIMANMSEEWKQSIVEAEVLAMKGGVPGSVKVKPALSIPGTSIGVGPNRPVPGSFTTTTPGQREKIASGSPTIDRGTYQQSRVGAGPTSSERQRYNAELIRQGKHTAPRMSQ